MSRPVTTRGRGECGQAALEYVGLLVLVVAIFALALYRVQLSAAGRAVAGAVAAAFSGSRSDPSIGRARTELEAAITGDGLSLPLAVERAEEALGGRAPSLLREELLARLPDGARVLLRPDGGHVDPATGAPVAVVRTGFGFHVVTPSDEARGRGLYQPDLHLVDVGDFAVGAGLDAAAGRAAEAAASALGRSLGGRGLLGSWSGSAGRTAIAEGSGETGAAVAGQLLRDAAGNRSVEGAAARALASFTAASNEALPPIGAQSGDVIVCTTERTLAVRLDRTAYGAPRLVAVGFRPGVGAYATGTLSDSSLCRPT